VIVLHGGGGNGGTMLPRWADKARSEGLVVAAPDGVGRMQGMGTWNAGGCCGEAMTSGLDDVAFVNAVVDDITRKGGIDTRRIYVAGFSNGGMLTHRFAIAHGDRIAAAAVVSGAMFGDEKPAATPVPMLIMHGRKDNVVGYDGGMSPTSFVARAQSAPFLPVERTVAFWRDADGCRAAPAVTTGGDDQRAILRMLRWIGSAVLQPGKRRSWLAGRYPQPGDARERSLHADQCHRGDLGFLQGSPALGSGPVTGAIEASKWRTYRAERRAAKTGRLCKRLSVRMEPFGRPRDLAKMAQRCVGGT
jgi:predicted esterase